VNDTSWSAAGAEAKAKTFVEHMSRIVDVARAKGIEVIFTRETHFSHSAAPDRWAFQISQTLEHLLRAADKLAAERNVPVIDVQGAYREAQAEAWLKDLKYEFTPDVIHPTQPGHAAMATELLRAMGVGLPLATAERGPLHLVRKAPVRLEALDAHGTVTETETITLNVRCRNFAPKPMKGDVMIVAGTCKATKPVSLTPNGMAMLEFQIPAETLTGRWACRPLYMAFTGDGVFTASHSPFYYSSIVNALKKAFTATTKDFRPYRGEGKQNCPVENVVVSFGRGGIDIEFKWADEKIVPAQKGFVGRFNKTIDAPLDLNERQGQPCDAIEFMFDFRPDKSRGRFTSNADSLPDGVVRVGAYRIEENGKMVTRLEPPAASPDKATIMSATFTDKGNGTFALHHPIRPGSSALGFSMRVTDTDEFGPGKGQIFYLTGRAHVSHEPMSYILLTKRTPGIFYRIGY
ncbi:MAG: SGNH/GDSL hydrolase family protein, partial [Planctomycetes bacterium]|nr:SGNH/GDSL hydrolase family protein [Planctomycetota bacterium]